MLRTRVITALLLVGGLLLALFLLPDAIWLAFAGLICAGGAWEWGGLTGFNRAQRLAFSLLAAVACVVVGWMSGLAAAPGASSFGLAPLYVLSACFWLLVVPVWLNRKWRIGGTAAAVAVGFVVLVPPALALAHLRQVGPWWLLAAMALVWVADICAYFTGRAFGRRKLAPSISPGKTWEGAAGAALGVVVFGVVVLWHRLPADGEAVRAAAMLAAALVGVTAMSVIGDLFESLLKRQAGVKDSGALLPGHGGILDRIDSLTSTLPLAGLAALWFAR